MDDSLRQVLRKTVVAARKLLEAAVRDRLEGRFSVHVKSGKLAADRSARLDHLADDERALRLALLDRLDEWKTEGTPGPEALAAIVRETAFTWLNRFVAFKMLEARKLGRETIARWDESNGFKHWLAENGFEDVPIGEERAGAYHRFLLDRCGELAAEVRALFAPDSLPSRLAPPAKALKQLADALNAAEIQAAWQPGNEEALGWVYQFFVEENKQAVFDKLYKKKQKIAAEDIPAATQIFTPNWMARFLVDNTLGRLWLETHPDSQIVNQCEYLAPFDPPAEPPPLRLARDLTLLDPACGTMHFGLVAFDVFAAMYREEIAHAGRPGWPEKPSVASEADIPAAILAHNLHGVDIDMRAVQIAALTLYLKAKALNPRAKLGESRLACANVHMLDGERLGAFLQEAGLDKRPIYRRALHALREELKASEQLGSLLPLEKRVRALVEEERKKYRKEGHRPDLFGWHKEQFETEAGREEFWRTLEIQIVQALDAFARQQAEAGVDQSFFTDEAVKGLRLLDLMAQSYDVVVANPPYLTARNMNAALKDGVAKHYPEGKADLYAAFIQRCVEWLAPGGRVGMVTQQSFMFISSYEKLRGWLGQRAVVSVMAHVGPRAFEEVTGEKVNTTLLVLRRGVEADAEGVYFRLVKEPDADAKRRRFEQALSVVRGQGPVATDDIVYRCPQANFAAIPGAPWVYWITPGLRKLFKTLPKLGDVAQPRQGLATADNFRFLRFWWEVGTERTAFGCKNADEAQATGKRWFPYMKGGSFRRWCGNQEYVVNWENDGEEIKDFQPAVIRNPGYYFRRGVTWSDLTSGRFSARLSPGGFIFDVKGSSAFPPNVEITLALLNSSIAHYMLNLLNPTVSFQVGDLARLPIPASSSPALESLVEQAIALAKVDSEEDETTWDFIAPPAWPDGLERAAARHSQLSEIERRIDEEVYRLYAIGDADRAAIEAELSVDSGQLSVVSGQWSADSGEDEEESTAADPSESESPTDHGPLATDNGQRTTGELAKRWISHAMSRVFASVAFHESGEPLARRALETLEKLLGEAAALEVVRAACGNGDPVEKLAADLARPFFDRHVRQYRKRPIYWLLQSPGKGFGVWLHALQYDGDTLYLILQKVVEPAIRARDATLGDLRGRYKDDSGNKRLRKEIDRLEDDLADLRSFEETLNRAAGLHLRPDVNDGVALNLAPLWELVPFKDAKKYWRELEAGEYRWSRVAEQLKKDG